jgi:two-component system, chemotaxis family, chemotaxis protein CheY
MNRMDNEPTPRLLAVDDNLDSAELIARIAEKSGYEARSMSDPRALVEVIAAWRPDILTLDLCMPQEDGVHLLALLAASGFAGQLIIISGQDGWMRKVARRLATARGLKVAEDLGKPLDIKELRRLLTTLKETASRSAA